MAKYYVCEWKEKLLAQLGRTILFVVDHGMVPVGGGLVLDTVVLVVRAERSEREPDLARSHSK